MDYFIYKLGYSRHHVFFTHVLSMASIFSGIKMMTTTIFGYDLIQSQGVTVTAIVRTIKSDHGDLSVLWG
jgi:hypothetical protein